MCGIIGYTGERDAVPVLLEGLDRLEYRGYDSVGVAVPNGRGLAVRKVKGRLGRLRKALDRAPLSAPIGIGHTRWATHGEPSVPNAHPHLDAARKVAVVHNGIIENYDRLRRELARKGYRFRSQTDTEVIAHAVARTYRGNLLEAVRTVTGKLEGSYALAVMHADEPGRIVVSRCGSPLIVGLGDGEQFCASDVPALLPYTRRIVHLEEGDTADLTPGGVVFYAPRGKRKRPVVERVTWDVGAAERGGYPHFMLKEIHEQPEGVEAALAGRIDLRRGDARFHDLSISDARLKRVRRAVVIACGTAWHAGWVGRIALEDLAGLPAQVEMSSEFRYGSPVLDDRTLVIAVSQSGETADTLAGVRLARARKAPVLAVCNVMGSTLTREADGVCYTRAGIEIGVAATKTYVTQLAVVLLLSVRLGRLRGMLPPRRAREILAGLADVPRAIRSVLRNERKIRSVARTFAADRYRNFMFVGRGYNCPTAYEGALKLKEISYRHAEGYGAGEMKHGPLALVDKHLPIVAVAVPGRVYPKMAANLEEIRARGGRLVVVGSERDRELPRKVRFWIGVPEVPEPVSPLVTAVPLQLFAYHLATALGRDVDRPRNLAKSVTVE